MTGKRIIHRTKAEIDPTILSTILTVISLGMGKRDAAIQAGISHETLYQYEQRGQVAWAKPEKDRTGRDEYWARFHIELQQAGLRPKVYLLGLLDKAAEGDWKAAAWLLEKLYPGEFGARVDVNARIGSEPIVRFDLGKLTMAELRELKRLRSKMGTENDIAVDCDRGSPRRSTDRS